MTRKRITHASLFSGFGGFDLAAEWAGFENVFNCEISLFCSLILNYYFPNAIQYGDIKTTDFTPWRGKIDILTGGFPCQPFSLAGQRKGTDDDRYLWPEMLRAISEIRPAWVIGENVGGIVSMVQPGGEVEVAAQATLLGEDYYTTQERQEFIIERICRDIEHLGYSIQPILIPACSVGSPHRRDRVWFVAENTQRVRCDGDQSEEEPRAGRFWQFSTGDHVRVCRGTQAMEDPGGSRCSESEILCEQPGRTTTFGTGGAWLSSQREGMEDPFTNGTDAGIEAMCESADGKNAAEYAAYAERCRGNEIHQDIQSRQPDGARTDSDGGERYATDTFDEGLERRIHCGEQTQAGLKYDFRADTAGCSVRNATHSESIGSSIAGRTRNRRTGFADGDCGGGLGGWQNFPTQSPVCCGNDGFPGQLDGFTFPKWRQESIKGFGNAVVPQVPLRIMEAIKEYELKQNNQ